MRLNLYKKEILFNDSKNKIFTFETFFAYFFNKNKEKKK